MTDKPWLIKDLFTGEEIYLLPRPTPDTPTDAWIQGWNDGMELQSRDNPYSDSTLEYHDWQEGYEAARRD
jgi:hypothetical protein